MFFSYDLLRHKGPMWVIWSLGNDAKKMTPKKREILGFGVKRACHTIRDRVPVTEPQHMSLRMASSLVLGLADCHLQQVRSLLNEISLSRKSISRPNFDDVPIDCTRTTNEKQLEDPLEGRNYAEDANYGNLDLSEMLKNTVPVEQITIREPDMADMEVMPDQDDDFGSFLNGELPPLEFSLQPLEAPEEDGPTPIDNNLLLEEKQIEVAEKTREGKRPGEPLPPRAPKRIRRNLDDENTLLESEEEQLEEMRIPQFEIPEVLHESTPEVEALPKGSVSIQIPLFEKRRGKMRRTRRLIVDKETQISNEEMRAARNNPIESRPVRNTATKKVDFFQGPTRQFLNKELRTYFHEKQAQAMEILSRSSSSDETHTDFLDLGTSVERQVPTEKNQTRLTDNMTNSHLEVPPLDDEASMIQDSLELPPVTAEEGMFDSQLLNIHDTPEKAGVEADLSANVPTSPHENAEFKVPTPPNDIESFFPSGSSKSPSQNSSTSRHDILSIPSREEIDTQNWINFIKNKTNNGQQVTDFMTILDNIETRRGIAVAFRHMLDLEAQKAITLEQSECLGPIKIYFSKI